MRNMRFRRDSQCKDLLIAVVSGQSSKHCAASSCSVNSDSDTAGRDCIVGHRGSIPRARRAFDRGEQASDER